VTNAMPNSTADSRRASALKRELSAAARVPYTALLNPHVVRTSLLDYVQVFRCDGLGFECADDEQLNNWHERLNILWRNIAGPHVALWTHIIRRREATPWEGGRRSGFAAALLDKYRERLARETLMVNELYVSVVYRPVAGSAAGLLARAVHRMQHGLSRSDTDAALDACDKLAEIICASLARYEPRRLGIYEVAGARYSALLEFLGVLLNGEWQRMPLVRGPLNHALATSRLLFGQEVIEYRLPITTRVAAMLGIKEYPTPSLIGMFNRLLSAPFPFVLAQSFTFLSKPTSQGLLQRQIHRLANAGDFGMLPQCSAVQPRKSRRGALRERRS